MDYLPFDLKPILYWLIPAYFALSIIWCCVFLAKIFARPIFYLQTLVDIAVITAAVYLSNGIHSDIVFLYLIPVIAATIVSEFATVIAGVAAMVFYTAVVGCELAGYTPAISHTHYGFNPDETVRVSIFALSTAFLAFQNRYITNRLKQGHQEITRLKDEFLFRTVHDLRSPSAAIRWILEKWSRPEVIERFPEIRGDLAAFNEFNDRILRFIQDLLDLAKGKEMSLKKETVDVPAVIRAVIAEFSPAFAEKNLTIHYQPDASLPKICGDHEKVREVFENLLDNAIKYNKTGGSVTITHGFNDGFLKTSVSDTGEGITPENLTKILTPYVRLSNRGLRGTGLGLYIIKTLTEKMNGKISAESEEGKGTTFHLFLKVHSESPAE